MKKPWLLLLIICVLPLWTAAAGSNGDEPAAGTVILPIPLDQYEVGAQPGDQSLGQILIERIRQQPFNLVATLIFLAAVVHTFMVGFFQKLAHRIEERHREKLQARQHAAGIPAHERTLEETSPLATACHFLGEVEAIFGIWCIPLFWAITYFHGWGSARYYVNNVVNYTEPVFVVIIMAIASTRPILRVSEQLLGKVAGLGGRSPRAWWFSILVLGPMLGSFITEPAAMTISALLLAKTVYALEPSRTFKYGTLGLLFVNISVGGTLTHFAAPPVLMVAAKWNWDMAFMFTQFGWKAFLGVVVATAIYAFFFRKEFVVLAAKAAARNTGGTSEREEPIPLWVTLTVLGFMGWTVLNLHNPPLVIAGFLFFIAFVKATETHQDDVKIKGPLLVGFFLAGLVTHGPLQQWWIAPILGQLGELSLFTGATILTAFNDNAAITFLASQVPEFDPSMGASAVVKQYAVVAGAVTGGGLTVIANAPNPAGLSLLNRFFNRGIASPLGLLVGALVPTGVMALAFLLL